jgi:hypothetical protein
MGSSVSNNSIIFVSTILPGEQGEFNSLLLVESIRKNGGKLASSPIWLFFPGNQSDFSAFVWNRLNELKIKLIPINPDIIMPQVFFMREVIALTWAEKLIEGQEETLVWMDSNTIVLNEPDQYILPVNKQLGYKPVHHLLLGSRYEDPLDPFWSEIYNVCKVKPSRVFPMRPMIEDNLMRPYFNAGLLVTSANQDLFSTWLKFFKKILKNPVINALMIEDQRYAIFLHQAILSAVILNKFTPSQIYELTGSYNYPLHLWREDHTARRPASLEDCITIRHEGLLNIDSWKKGNPFNNDQSDWIMEMISTYHSNR